MRTTSLFVVAALPLVSIVGCNPKTNTAAPSVEYYRTHSDEREQQMKECQSDAALDPPA